MDNKVGNKGYGTTSSSPGVGPSESARRRHETGTHERYKHHAKNDGTEQPAPSRQFAGRPCSTRLARPYGVSGSTGPGSVIGDISGPRLAPKTSAYSISQLAAVTQLSPPHNRSSATDSSAKSLSDIARVCCEIFHKEIYPRLQFMNDVIEQDVLKAVSTLQNSVTVMQHLKALKPDTKLDIEHKRALEEVATAYLTMPVAGTTNSETGSRAKKSESTVEGNWQKYSPRYDLRAQTAANRPGQSEGTNAPQPPKVKIKRPVLTRSRQSPGMGTQREIQDARSDRFKPQARQCVPIPPTKNKQDRPLTPVADPSDDAFLGLSGEDLTKSLLFDIRIGRAAANSIKHARQPEELSPKVSSQNVVATSALAKGLNLPKAPDPGGARRKHPIPRVGNWSTAPVTTAGSDAALKEVRHSPVQRFTQSSPEADSKHLGRATEDQIVQIARNLGANDPDEETRKKIIDIINSSDLDQHTIEKAAGRRWEQGTPEALLLLQTEYACRETSPPAGPSVKAGHGSALAAASNADRPENSISDSNMSNQVIEAVGGRHTIAPDSRCSEKDEGGYDLSEALWEAMNEEVGLPSSGHSSGSSPDSSWHFVDTKPDGHGGTGYLIRAETQATHWPDHPQRQAAEPWVALGMNDPTPSLVFDLNNQKIDTSALPDQSENTRITEAQIPKIMKQFKKSIPMDAATEEKIWRNIGTIELTTTEVKAAIHGGRDSLCIILAKCLQGPSLPQQAVSHTDGRNTHPSEATVRPAGIQARNNNCSLASFFMCLSHDGVLDTLISDANHRIETLQHSRKFNDARSLESLVRLLKKFNTGGNTDKYIPNNELDKIRSHFSLGAIELKSEAIDFAFNKGGPVRLVVESEFIDGTQLINDNKKAAISLAISAVPKHGSLYATVISLPDSSTGCMVLKGTPLVTGQQITKADLKDLKFVPFGEQLEHNELINKMLSEIYGYLNTEAEPLQSISQLERVPMSLKQKVTLIEMSHDRKELEKTTRKAPNFMTAIKEEEVPGNLKLKKRETKPHEYNRNTIGQTIEYYHNENDILSLKLTKEHHHAHRGVIRKNFEYFDKDGNLSEKIILGMDKHCLLDASFVRSRESEKVENGERIKVEEVLTGYSQNTPHSGNVVTTKIKRADNFQDLIDIFIDGLKGKYSNGALKALLPEGKDDCPEVIFMVIPNEGKHKRCKLDWQKDVSLPTLQGDKKVTYGADAMVTIAESHFLAWLRDRKNGLLHYTDSMGDSEDNVTIPVVVTMPDQNTEAALQIADQKVNGIHRHFREAEGKLKVLDSQMALVMLKRKD
ncbi:hypothetical protein [Endozoicomonas sp. ALB091]|uniref:hypothetical protein n=1 Tax=Endozoicomonas sp. ALB091 TaxID=3403073 RepID=UPI003BB7C718